MSSAATTPNLALPQWTTGEKPERTDFNAALLAIDGIGTMGTWTPTLTGITIGAGAVVARFRKIGKLVYFEFSLTFAADTSITGAVSLSMPAEAKSMRLIYGDIYDSGGSFYLLCGYLNGTTCSCRVTNSAGTYLTASTALSSTIPITWAVGDIIHLMGTYEAA